MLSPLRRTAIRPLVLHLGQNSLIRRGAIYEYTPLGLRRGNFQIDRPVPTKVAALISDHALPLRSEPPHRYFCWLGTMGFGFRVHFGQRGEAHAG